MDQPVVVCGLGQVGWRVLEYLQVAGLPVVAIDNSCSADDPRLKKVRFIRGDFRQQEVLEQVDLSKARGVLILTSDDLINISTALMVRHLQPEVRVVVRMFNQNLLARLGKAVRNTSALSVSGLAAPLLAATALTGQALGSFRLEGGCFQVAEVTAVEGAALTGHRIGETAGRYQVVPLAHLPTQGGDQFLSGVDADRRVAAGDRLVVCGDPRNVKLLLAEAGAEALPDLLWAGQLRRLGRMVWRTLAEVDLPVKICTGVLLSVVLISTVVFHAWIRNDPFFAKSLYRTISVIATGADMHGDELRNDLKDDMPLVFLSIMRVTGAALIAAFTAIVTNYLLRARLSGALEVRRIPDGGHVIICGLGNLGFRVLEELLQNGERVVVIEPQRDGRFMATARRLGAAVIVGDATVLEVLRQAHAASARAVVAATNLELANLEIALLARELNPKQRVVVRLLDPQLAQTVRQEADIRFALSIPTLAAPAFVAALFGDRVLGVFYLRDRLIAVVELVVRPDDAFMLDQAVRALAIDYGLLPWSLIGADGQLRPQPMNQRLRAGDRLTVLGALTDLRRLLRRERVPADRSVALTGFGLMARPTVLELLRTKKGLTAKSAEAALEELPLEVSSGLTCGQAEDLVFTLRLEGIQAQIGQTDGSASPKAPITARP
jgi:Trk K+ transport system NAD-binding subunit